MGDVAWPLGSRVPDVILDGDLEVLWEVECAPFQGTSSTFFALPVVMQDAC